ncbi:MAG: TetR/AcrR family transcriptional regulator [Janthinobacterium lividum]
MSNTSDPQELKKKQILDAAYKRFSHYGYSKTTMNEIAGDLSMSKALLYYYFPDKSQLYAGVIRKLSDEYLAALQHKLNQNCTINEAFYFVLQRIHRTISSHYNFFDYFRLHQQNIPDSIWNIIREIHQTEVNLLTELYRKQVSDTFAETHNLQEIIELIFNALDSVQNIFDKHKQPIFPDVEQYEIMYAQKKLLLSILLNGLKTL